jgi:C4-dicarboxylate transporter DctQ subunit
MSRFADYFEKVGALALFLIMVLVTLSAITRYIFNWILPDGDSVAKYLLGIVIFWGLVSVIRHDEHIRVDLLWEWMSPTGRNILFFCYAGLTTVFLCFMAGTAFFRIQEVYSSLEGTYDLRIPIWPFLALAWLGMLASVLVSLLCLTQRKVRL